MQPDLSQLQSQLEELSRRLDRLTRRVERLEAGSTGASRASRPAERLDEAGALESAGVGEARRKRASSLPLVGRTLVVLGGAFLIRAVTEAGVLPQTAGYAAGLAYALLWIVLSNGRAAKGHGASAAFHGLAGSLIGYPLVWEATVKFGFVSTTVSFLSIVLLTGLALAIAGRREMRALAWVNTLFSGPTALALAFGTRVWTPFLGFILLLGAGSLWLGYLRRWAFIGWVVALGVDFSLLLAGGLFLTDPKPEFIQGLGSVPLTLLLLGLVPVYLGSFAVRTLLRGRNILHVEIFQGVVALTIGFGGAVLVGGGTPRAHLILGLFSAFLAAGCYGVSFAFIDRRSGRGRNFLFYTAMALIFTLMTLLLLLDGASLGIALAFASALAAWLGSSRQRVTLSLHGAVYIVAAALATELLSSSVAVFIGGAMSPSVPLGPPVFLTLAVAALGSGLSVVRSAPPWGRWSRLPKLVFLATLVVGVDGVLVSVARDVLLGGAETSTGSGLVAALRTVVLSLTVVALARVGQTRRFGEAAWLVYPLLVLAGAKLLIQDLRAGSSSTIFISLAAYGGALILAPRLTRHRPDDRTSEG